MNRPYLLWAIIGMLGYSFTALFVKLSTASGRFSSFLVLTLAGLIVFPTAAAITLFRGDIKALAWTDFASNDALFALATAIALTVAVSSFSSPSPSGPRAWSCRFTACSSSAEPYSA